MSNKELLQKLRQVLSEKTQPLIDLIYSIIVLATKYYIFDSILSSQLSLGLTLLLLTTGLGLSHKVKMNVLASIFELLINTNQDDKCDQG